MLTTNEIHFRPHSKVVVLREDFVAICYGDKCAAMILDVHMGHYEDAVAMRSSLWLPMTQAAMREALLRRFGIGAISEAYSLLTQHGFLIAKEDPNPLVRARKFLFSVETIQNAVNSLPILD